MKIKPPATKQYRVPAGTLTLAEALARRIADRERPLDDETRHMARALLVGIATLTTPQQH